MKYKKVFGGLILSIGVTHLVFAQDADNGAEAKGEGKSHVAPPVKDYGNPQDIFSLSRKFEFETFSLADIKERIKPNTIKAITISRDPSFLLAGIWNNSPEKAAKLAKSTHLRAMIELDNGKALEVSIGENLNSADIDKLYANAQPVKRTVLSNVLNPDGGPLTEAELKANAPVVETHMVLSNPDLLFDLFGDVKLRSGSSESLDGHEKVLAYFVKK